MTRTIIGVGGSIGDIAIADASGRKDQVWSAFLDPNRLAALERHHAMTFDHQCVFPS